MSHKGNRQLIVWILIALLFATALAAPVGMRSMVTLPGAGYRAYEWKWVVRFEGMKEDTGWPYWADRLRDAIKQELGNNKDDNGQPVVIYQGPTISYYDFTRTSGNLWDYCSFTAEAHTWFYGYFPNNIPEAIPLDSQMFNPLDRLLDLVVPKAYAAFWVPLAIMVVAVVAYLIASTAIQAWQSYENTLSERQRWEDIFHDPNIPPATKVAYAIVQSILGFLNTLGPIWILLIAAVAAILIFSGGGGRRHR